VNSVHPCGGSSGFVWTAFLRKLARRGLRGVKLVISDSHEGIKAAVSKVLSTTWQRCQVHFMRNVLAHADSRAGGSSPPSSPPRP
jgi:transposase-like protein